MKEDNFSNSRLGIKLNNIKILMGVQNMVSLIVKSYKSEMCKCMGVIDMHNKKSIITINLNIDLMRETPRIR